MIKIIILSCLLFSCESIVKTWNYFNSPVSFYDQKTYENLTLLKAETLFIYDEFTNITFDTDKINGFKLTIEIDYEYESGKGLANVDTAEQFKVLKKIIYRHIDDRLKLIWTPFHSTNKRELVSQAFDVIIKTERSKVVK
jgi:hypothetical protein